MITTNNIEHSKKVKSLRSHGITKDSSQFEKNNDGPWYYEQHDLGFNYRMSDIQAALGLSQLAKLNTFIKKRYQIKKVYDLELADLPIKLPHISKDCTSSMHLYIILLELDKSSISHREFFQSLRDSGIGVNLHYIPIYKQPYFNRFNIDEDSYPVSNDYYKRAISLPIYPSLSEKTCQNY